MKKLIFLTALLFWFSHVSYGQTISCSVTLFKLQNYDFKDHTPFNMNSANTPIIVRTKPKGIIKFYTMALGNPVTHIPENYTLVYDSSNSNDEWDAWISTTPVGHPNRNSFHIQGRFKDPNYQYPGNAGDMIPFYVTGVPSNNDAYPTPTFMNSFPLEQWGSASTFLDSVVVDDILAGETATVEIGTLIRGSVKVSDNYGSTTVTNMPTDNPNVTIDIFSSDGNLEGYFSQPMDPLETNRQSPVFARIKTNSSATGTYSKTITLTANCP